MTNREEIERRRTFAIISHPDAGKTTLTEKLLLYGGAINQAGSVGGAHRDPKTTIEKVGDSILKHLKELLPLSGDELKKQRTAKFLAMGRNLPEN